MVTVGPEHGEDRGVDAGWVAPQLGVGYSLDRRTNGRRERRSGLQPAQQRVALLGRELGDDPPFVTGVAEASDLGAQDAPHLGFWAVAAQERCARAAGTRWNGSGDRCVRAVAAGWTGSRVGGRTALVGPGWSGTGAWTSYAPRM